MMRGKEVCILQIYRQFSDFFFYSLVISGLPHPSSLSSSEASNEQYIYWMLPDIFKKLCTLCHASISSHLILTTMVGGTHAPNFQFDEWGNWGLERLGDLVRCPFRWQRSTKSSVFVSLLHCQTGPFKLLGLPLFLPNWEQGDPKGLNDWKTPWTIFPNSLSHFNLWVWVKDKPILIQSQVLNLPLLLDL